MSSDYYRRQAQQCQKDIARLQGDKGHEAQRIADLQRGINNASQSASRASNPSSAASYLREVERLQADIARTQKNIAYIEEKIARASVDTQNRPKVDT